MKAANRCSPAGAAAAALVLLAAPCASADGLQAGLWKVISKPVIDGMAGPDQEKMRCLTPAEVGDLEKTFSPVGGTINSECKEAEREFTPQRLKWHLQCKGQVDMDVAGEFIFDKPEHYTATIATQTAVLGRIVQRSRTTVEGERVGECP